MKPFAESCEQNRDPILAVLRELFTEPATVLELGSGTGQHAVYFARHLPHLNWQTSDLPENLPGINTWIDDEDLANVRHPLVLDVSDQPWPVSSVDHVFTANSLHIMSWASVQQLITGAGNIITTGGRMVVYGPFNYSNQYTSDSNARFDSWLKSRDPLSGIRNFEDLDTLAQNAGMQLFADYEMPVNNRILVWQKV
jgi:cyclopropane fatty-acyl-phospholipid synthase-like methyltransferase